MAASGIRTSRCATGRQQGDSAGKWTLKLPAAAEGPTLNRTEVSWEGPRDEIPRDASAIVRGLVRQQPLQQLVELASTRQRLLLHDAADRTLAEIDDDTVTVNGGPRDGLRFRQVELELHDADAKVVRKVTARLQGVGLSPETTPKLERAMGVLASPAAERQLGPNSSLGDVVRSVLTQGLSPTLGTRLATPRRNGRSSVPTTSIRLASPPVDSALTCAPSTSFSIRCG